jgi:hypothetical protein
MVLTLYHTPRSFPSRAALLVARAVGVDVTVKYIDLLEKEQLSPEFIKVSNNFLCICRHISQACVRATYLCHIAHPRHVTPSGATDFD